MHDETTDWFLEAGRAHTKCMELTAEIERLRGTLELIAGTATDKLQAMQARAALDNIGAPVETSGKTS